MIIMTPIVQFNTINILFFESSKLFINVEIFKILSYFIASMPLVISDTSAVIAAWRTLLKVRV